jgi:hypothetical protein
LSRAEIFFPKRRAGDNAQFHGRLSPNLKLSGARFCMSERINKLKQQLRLAKKENATLRADPKEHSKPVDKSRPSSGVSQEIKRQTESGKKTNGKTDKVKVGTVISWFFGVGVGSLCNNISNDPRVLYFSTGAIIVWVIWLFRKWGWKWVCAAIVFSIFLIFPAHKLVVYKESLEISESDRIAGIERALTNRPPTFIKGTKYTFDDMERLFPFGYMVLFANGDKMVFESGPYKSSQWTEDWNQANITADFSTHTFVYSLPGIKFASYADYGGVDLSNLVFTNHRPFKVGEFHKPPLVGIEGVPRAFVGLLGGDQKDYVFVMGLRIDDATPRPDFLKPRNQAN